MTDLLADLYAEIDRRETSAKAATQGRWACYGSAPFEVYVEPGMEDDAPYIAHVIRTQADAHHIADNDPATVLRGLAEDRDILRRHADDRASGRHWCYVFGEDGRGRLLTILPNECPEVLSLARRLGVPHA